MRNAWLATIQAPEHDVGVRSGRGGVAGTEIGRVDRCRHQGGLLDQTGEDADHAQAQIRGIRDLRRARSDAPHLRPCLPAATPRWG
jgi:hypothetical protein